MTSSLTGLRGAVMLAAALTAGVAPCAAAAAAAAGGTCPNPAYAPRGAPDLATWHDVYVRPFRAFAGTAENPSTPDQLADLVETQRAFNRRSTRDTLFFEAWVQQIAQHYARAPDFSGIDMQAARKVYRQGSGPELDFSLLCIDSRTIGARDDAFALTLFGVVYDDCRHVGLRGLVFTDTLINGAANGQCRPDHVYYRNIFFPINAGTNTVTFVCRKDSGGCYRQ